MRGRESTREGEGTRIVAHIVIALGMIVLGVFIFKKNSNRRATLINKADIKISGLGMKLIEIYTSFFSRNRLKPV